MDGEVVSERCGANPYAGQVHTCDDPVGCAIDRLIRGDDPTEAELERLHELLDRVEDLCEGSKAKVSESVLTEIHRERGGL